MGAKLSYCEPSHVTGMGPWCLRYLTDQGKKLGGGVDSFSFCHRVKPGAGWDLEADPPDDLQSLREIDHVCKKCVEALLDAGPMVQVTTVQPDEAEVRRLADEMHEKVRTALEGFRWEEQDTPAKVTAAIRKLIQERIETLPPSRYYLVGALRTMGFCLPADIPNDALVPKSAVQVETGADPDDPRTMVVSMKLTQPLDVIVMDFSDIKIGTEG